MMLVVGFPMRWCFQVSELGPLCGRMLTRTVFAERNTTRVLTASWPCVRPVVVVGAGEEYNGQ